MAKLNTALRNLQFEVDTAYLYAELAQLEKQPEVAQVFQKLSETERHHAEAFLKKIEREVGQPVQMLAPSRSAKLKAWLAQKFGPQIILGTLLEAEKAVSNALVQQKKAKGLQPSGFESTHPRILKNLMQLSSKGLEGGQITQLEGRHQSIGGNALRAAVLGANDGLVSNLSLVMGVAGASASNQNILIAGFAGLLAGAISMALGEWLSVQSSRELYERQLEIEEEELTSNPEEEMQELALIYQAKGVSEQEAKNIARKIIENKDMALDTLAREELGIDPEELGGSAWEAAFASFFLFAIGAIIPLAPFLFLEGTQGIITSLVASAVGLFGIGAAITLITSKPVWKSGMRQVLFGLAAAAVTYGIGYLVGVNLG